MESSHGRDKANGLRRIESLSERSKSADAPMNDHGALGCDGIHFVVCGANGMDLPASSRY